jgi:hypothetical protein
MSPYDPFTVEFAARFLLARLAPAELDDLPVLLAGYEYDRDVRRRIAKDVVSGRHRGPAPVAVAPAVVVILDAVTTGLIEEWNVLGAGTRRRRRRTVRLITRTAAAEGTLTPLPQVSAGEAGRMARLGREAAMRAGWSRTEATILLNLLAEMLTVVPAPEVIRRALSHARHGADPPLPARTQDRPVREGRSV